MRRHFTPEDFNEEQIMMRDSVIEFVDKELYLKTKSALKERLCTY